MLTALMKDHWPKDIDNSRIGMSELRSRVTENKLNIIEWNELVHIKQCDSANTVLLWTWNVHEMEIEYDADKSITFEEMSIVC